MEFSEAYENLCDEGAEGLTQSQAYDFLCNIGQNPSGLDFYDFKQKKGKSDKDLFTLEELDELNKSLGDPENKLREAFKVFDHDNDGYVSKEELREMLKETDIYESGLHSDKEFWESYWQETLNAGDTNGDGKLDIDELVKLLLEGGVTM